MGSKRFKNHICVYCAKEQAVTGDHIFAREFFLPAHRDNLPQAPTCEACNNEKSKLEHYLTALLPFGGRHNHALDNLSQQVPKRLKRNQRLHKELNQGRSKIEAVENGQLTKTMALPIRTGSVELLFQYIIKGLVWHHWGVYLSTKDFVEVIVLSSAGQKFFQQRFFSLRSKNRVLVNVGEGTVIYEGIQA